MNYRIALLAAASFALASCGSGGVEGAKEARATKVKVTGVVIGGKTVPCIQARSLNLYNNTSNELSGSLREQFLTPEAAKANVRVFSAGSDVTGFGSNVIHYMDEAATCLLWSETLGLQEYAEKAGLSPLGVVKGYEPATKAPPKVTATP